MNSDCYSIAKSLEGIRNVYVYVIVHVRMYVYCIHYMLPYRAILVINK